MSRITFQFSKLDELSGVNCSNLVRDIGISIDENVQYLLGNCPSCIGMLPSIAYPMNFDLRAHCYDNHN